VTPSTGLISVIGCDPGPTTGLCLLEYAGDVIVGRTSVQVDGDSAQYVLEAVLRAYLADPERVVKRYAEVEAFVTGQGAGTKGGNADYTRQEVFKFTEQLQMWGYSVKIRKAADIKTWASDKRLKAAGILRSPENRHSNDGGRHAIFCATHDAFRSDPLR
jgi:hypothetical protein